jgi:hypothetical protein
MKAMHNSSTIRRILGAVAIAVLSAVAVAGCGGAGQGVSPVPPATPTGQLADCALHHLRILVDPSASRPAVQGGSYLPIDFVNTSGTSCAISGFPRVVALTPTGRHNATASRVHVRGVAQSALLLAPNYTAHTWLLIADQPGGKGSGCRPFSATGLRISPPRNAGFVWVDWPLQLCVPAGDAVLSVQAVQAGLANATTFP